MDISCFRVKNLSYIVIDNFYTDEELEQVKTEVNEVRRFSESPCKTNTAVDENSNPKKTGTGLFLDDLYFGKRNLSAVLTYNRKIFGKEFTKRAEEFDVVFRFIRESNHDSTLINYYDKGQEYKSHIDTSQISVVCFLVEEGFQGGEFLFPGQEISIPCVNNRAVVFPSCTEHQAAPVIGGGERISIAQFIDHVQKV